MTDLLLTASLDLDVTTDGDMGDEDAVANNVKLLLQSMPGSFRDFPTLGVGIEEFLSGKNSAALLSGRIRDAVAADGGKARKVAIVTKSGALDVAVDAVYD